MSPSSCSNAVTSIDWSRSTIEREYADRLDDFFSVLALQFANAGEWAKAREYLIKAGDQAVRIAADAEALALYREAFAARERAGEAWERAERGVLERKMGEALFRRGEHVEAREHLERSLNYLDRPFPRSRSAVRLAVLGHALRQAGHRLTPIFFRAKPAAQIEEVIRTSETMGWIVFFADPERLALTSLRILNYSEEAGYTFGTAYGSMGIGLLSSALPQHGMAGWYFRRPSRLPRVPVTPCVGPRVPRPCVPLQHGVGDGGAAGVFYEKATSAYRQSGDVWRWSSPAGLWSQLLRYLGETEQALRMAEEIVRPGEEGGDAVIRINGLLRLGSALMQAGDLDPAESALRATIELGERIPDYQHLVCAQGFLAPRSCTAGGSMSDKTARGGRGADRASPGAHVLRDSGSDIARRSVPVERRGGDGAAMRSARSAVKRCISQGRIESRPGRRHSESRARCSG